MRSAPFLAALAAFAIGSPLASSTAQSAPPAAPFSCADTTSLALGFLVGEYEASAVFRAGPAAWDSTRARVSVSRALHGCVLHEHFRGTRYGAPYEYLAVWGAHGGAATPIQRMFVHSQHGLLGLAEGGVVGDSLVLEDSVFLRQRWVFQRLLLWREDGNGDRLRSEGRRSEDGRASWILTQRTHYRRRVAAPAGRVNKRNDR